MVSFSEVHKHSYSFCFKETIHTVMVIGIPLWWEGGEGWLPVAFRVEFTALIKTLDRILFTHQRRSHLLEQAHVSQARKARMPADELPAE